MNFTSKYTWGNIKANKLRAALLVACIAFASVLFFVSMAFPLYLRNYWEETMRSYFGNSDIYMQVTETGLGTMDSIPENMKKNFEYSLGFLAFPSTMFSTATKKDEPVTYVSGNFADVQTFNPVKIKMGDATGFDDPDSKKAIITESAARILGLKLGDYFRAKAFGTGGDFYVAAIVANEGLLSENNEVNGPMILLSKAGTMPMIKQVVNSGEFDLTLEEAQTAFTMAVFKVRSGVDIRGMASELAEIFPGFEVKETVNNEVLAQSVGYLNTPFVACIYLVCAFCALIIYLTCKLTFSERVRQFAVLKSMGSSTSSLFGSLLLESSFYGFLGGAISIVFALLQVYCLPIIAPKMTYVTPVPFWYYLCAVLFGVGIAVASSFIQALKNARKSIKQTLLYKEKFTKQKFWVSIVSTSVFVVMAIVMVATYNISFKMLSIPFFLIALIALIFALPFIMSGMFWVIKKVFRRKSFETLYFEKTLPSKNLSVASRLLFFGMFLVFMFSTLITSLNKLIVVGQKMPYDIFMSQVTSTTVTQENIEEIRQQEGVERAWEGVCVRKSYISLKNVYLSVLYGLKREDIDYLYKDQIEDYDKVMSNFSNGKIILNKWYRDSLGCRLGQIISLNVGVRTVQTLEFEIVGFIDSYSDWADFAVCLIDDLSEAENVEGYNNIYIQVKDGYNADNVIASIRKLDFIGQGDETGESAPGQFISFTNSEKAAQIFIDQMHAPMLILRTYSVLVLILSLLCIFIGYVLYLRESSEYHKTLFALGMSPSRFQSLILKQSIFMTIMLVLCALVLSAVLYLNLENIFNALGIAFTTKVNYFEYSMYAIGMFIGTTLMALGLGEYFKRDLMRGDKRLFG